MFDRETSLHDIIYSIIKGWKIIAISVLVCLFISIIYVSLFINRDAYYITNASMVINSKTYSLVDGVLKISRENDVYLAQKMVNTYRVILLSDNVLEKVNLDLGINIPSSLIRSWVSVSSPRDTEVITVTVINKDPKLAADIANSIMRVAPQVIRETVEVGSINVLDKAKVPKIPVKTSKIKIFLYIILGSMLGIPFGGIITLIISIFNPKLKNKKEVTKLLSLKCLGEIPHVKEGGNKDRDDILITNGNLAPSYKEEYKNLTELVIHACENEGINTLIVTSAVPEEGKTNVSVNLALSMASAGKKTLLIDFDCYQEGIMRLLKQKSERYLNDIISGEISYTEAIIEEPETGLHMIFSEKGKHLDYNLMNSPMVENLFKIIKIEYDYVIIDTPPVLLQTDAVLLSKYIDGVILVAKQEAANISSIIEARDKVRSIGAKIIGCVLNDIRYLIGTEYKSKYSYSKTYYNGNREGKKFSKVYLYNIVIVGIKIISIVLLLLTVFVFIYFTTRTDEEITRIIDKIMNFIARHGFEMAYTTQAMEYWIYGILYFIFTTVTLITLKVYGIKTLYVVVITPILFLLLAFGGEYYQALFVAGRMYEIKDVAFSILGMAASFAVYGFCSLIMRINKAGDIRNWVKVDG